MQSTLGTMFETYADRALARIAEVLDKGVIGHRTLEADERAFLRLMQDHVEKRRALPRSRCVDRLRGALAWPSMSEKAREALMNERRLREIVHQLRLHGLAIGSTSDRDGGHYIITSTDEAKDSTQYMFSQAVSFFRVIKALRTDMDEDALLDLIRTELRKPESEGR